MTTAAYRVVEVEDAGASPCSCDSCDWEGPASSTTDVEDCCLTPGDASPVGRCPECSSLAYLAKPLREKNALAAVMKYLDISTGHLTVETRLWLGGALPSRSHCSGITIAPYEYGCFCSVPANREAIESLECDDDLKVVLQYAMQLDCVVVRFDADADCVSDLPMYED